ncbi:uncharacterized protein LOC143249000 isoform X4 [Tachypleus tridentatus]|uniref:uncharacterized protein LOC143249000 isoform X4 n=1 Tax=Tachypleus tridentatus TaxID=6853 RepID=UPI003FD1D7CD
MNNSQFDSAQNLFIRAHYGECENKLYELLSTVTKSRMAQIKTDEQRINYGKLQSSWDRPTEYNVKNKRVTVALPVKVSSKKESTSNYMVYQSWIFQVNIIICKLKSFYMSSSKTENEIKEIVKSLHNLLFESQGIHPTKESIAVEGTLLYTLLIVTLKKPDKYHSSLTVLWTICLKFFERAFHFVVGSGPCVPCGIVDDSIELMQGIIYHSSGMFMAKYMQVEIKTVIFYVSLAMYWMSMIQKKTELGKALVNIMNHLKEAQQWLGLMHPSSLTPFLVPSTTALLAVSTACHSFQRGQLKHALSALNTLQSSMWSSFVTYFKGYLHFLLQQYNEGLNSVLSFWELQNENLDKNVKAKFYNLIGSFLEEQKKPSLAWFQQSLNEDDSFFVSVWNVATYFRKLGNHKAEMETLELLVKSTVNQNLYQSNYYKLEGPNGTGLWLLSSAPEVSHLQATYALARRLLEIGMYPQVSTWYNRILHYFHIDRISQITPPQEKYPAFVGVVYLEACYALMHSGYFQKCIDACDNILNILTDEQVINMSFEYVAREHKSTNLTSTALNSIETATLTSCKAQVSCPRSLSQQIEAIPKSNQLEEKGFLSHSAKRNRSFSCEHVLEEEPKICGSASCEIVWTNLPFGSVLLAVKAAAYHHLEETEAALEALRKAQQLLESRYISLISNFDKKDEQQKVHLKTPWKVNGKSGEMEIRKENWEESNEPSAKRPRLFLSTEHTENIASFQFLEESKLDIFKSQLYNNQAVLRIKNKQWKDALVLLKLALTLWQVATWM